MFDVVCQKLRNRLTASRRARPRPTGQRTALGQPIGKMTVPFARQRVDVSVRECTTDIDLVHMILCDHSEYRLPDAVQPSVIFDVGANIGVTAIYYALRYPDARIYCFEPFPDNVELLSRNVKPFADRVTIVPKGLSDEPGSLTYHMSNDPRNFGGGGFTTVGVDMDRTVELPVVSVAQAIADLCIDRVDLIKVDTEGSELPIIRGVPRDIREDCQAVIGELHGVGDWELCELLRHSHDLEVHKRLTSNCFPFLAVRRDLVRGQHAAA